MRKRTFLVAQFKDDGNVELILDTEAHTSLLLVVAARLAIELGKRDVTLQQIEERMRAQLEGEYKFKDCPPPIVITGDKG